MRDSLTAYMTALSFVSLIAIVILAFKMHDIGLEIFSILSLLCVSYLARELLTF